MSNSNLIKLVLAQLDCNQQSLAKKVGVSSAQISKWKSGEYMSLRMTKKLTELADIGKYDPDFVYWTGGLKQSKKWYKLISDLAESAEGQAETGYHTVPLQEEENRMILCCETISILREMGVIIPQEFPVDLIFDQFDDDDLYWHAIEDNSISKLIHEGFMALNNLYGFYAAYIHDLVYYGFDAESNLYDIGDEVEANLLSLAFAKIGEESDFLPNFNKFRYETRKSYTDWIVRLKDSAVKCHIPLKWELSDLVSKDSDSLGHDAERESLGFNEQQLHPDIYMDEILRNLRLVHQVLPIICKKLGIKEDEYKFDGTEFHN